MARIYTMTKEARENGTDWESAIYNGEILGTSDMITTADVARSELLYTFYKIEQFTKSKFFIATIVSAVILTVIYIFGNAFLRARRPTRRRF